MALQTAVLWIFLLHVNVLYFINFLLCESEMLKKQMVVGFMVLSAVMLSGCATGYKDFYKSANDATLKLIALRRSSSPPTTPIVERAQPSTAQSIVDAYSKRGYSMIGSSTFNSGKKESEDVAIQQGRDVGADLVLILNPQYTGSVTTSIPITTPTTSVAHTSGTATAYGAGAPVTAYGNSTTTTHGTETNYIPMTINRLNYGAAFFVKLRFAFGAFTRDLTDVERQDLQSNKGAVIRLIVDNSPAFDADILVGDIVTAIDGISVSNAMGFGTMLQGREGRKVVVSLIRRGQRLEKTIQLGA